jgi:hemin uptake protein HemP
MPAPSCDIEPLRRTPRLPSANPVRVTACDPLPAPAPGGPAALPNRRYSSDQLFGDSVEVEIEHGASTYRLRRTALGKLILTK